MWDNNKHDIVLNGNIAKFTQNENLKEYILKTKDKIIVEASPYDNIWGIGIREDHKNATKPHLWQGKKSTRIHTNGSERHNSRNGK